MANALVESARQLGRTTGKARVTRSEHHQETMNQNAAEQQSGQRPRKAAMNQGSLGRNGKRGMTV